MSEIKKKEVLETKNFNEFFDELNDMANFKNFGESKEEEITNADGSRNWEANILLDNVKRLEQENVELKAENERLKEELEPYKHPDVITLLTNWRTGELDRTHNKIANERDKYRQTLQEIKAIVCGNYEIIDPQGRKDILKLITKAEEE